MNRAIRIIFAMMLLTAGQVGGQPIDRKALVSRHNVTVTSFDPLTPLSVGNGEFAFTVDPTGLQTFPQFYEGPNRTPLCTLAQWGWHTIPLPADLRGVELRAEPYGTHGRSVGYFTSTQGQERLFNWLRENPHRLNLARIGLDLRKTDGSAASPEDLKNVRQTLDLWTGIITSEFEFEGKPVKVQTCVGGAFDAISVKVESPLKIPVTISFPYGSPDRNASDWSRPQAHNTRIIVQNDRAMDLERVLDADRYYVRMNWSAGTRCQQTDRHQFQLRSDSDSMEFVCRFFPKEQDQPRQMASLQSTSSGFWADFWSKGGAIDLSGSTDPRWRELERRIVLSQYLTRINCAGSLPPAETGLVCNSWYGKFHLEMHWWHVAHFAFWGRQELFEKSMGYYQSILPAARELAKSQGYRGARWPKMTDPAGRDSPSTIGPLLIWQQPNPIYYAELCYRAHPDRQTLGHWRAIVEESAEFMASFAVRDPQAGQYNLGPPIKTVPEHTDARSVVNPGFELSYWRFGLRVAQAWRERLNEPRNPQWDEVLNHLAPLPVKDGLYLSEQSQPDTWTNWTWEHPSLIGGLGMLPGDGVDRAIMRNTLEKVMQVWQWDRCWGWDFPMTAMSAARVGRADLAVDALLISSYKNSYLPSGHNFQRDNLTLYLPGNGGLLSAVAMMAAGWDGAPELHAPGFPREGWNVRWEGLKRMP